MEVWLFILWKFIYWQNSNLGGFTPIIDETGKITGYKTTVGGADTVFPFKKTALYDFYTEADTIWLSKTTGDSLDYSNRTYVRKNNIPCVFIHNVEGSNSGFIVVAKSTDAFDSTISTYVSNTPVQFTTPSGKTAYYAKSVLWNVTNKTLTVNINGKTYTSVYGEQINYTGDLLLKFLGILADEML